MKKGRKIKFTLGMKIASILCCVALVSVGFAAWWIVEFPQAKETTAGSFTVYDVTSKEIEITNVKFLDDDADATPTAVDFETPDANIDDAKIIFGHPVETNTTANWFGYDDSKVQAEDLETILQFDVAIKNADNEDPISKFIETIKISFNVGDKYHALIGQGVAAPVVSYRIGTTGEFGTATAKTYVKTPDVDNAPLEIEIPKAEFATGESVTVQVKFEFGWSFSGQTENPFDYYNAQDYTNELGSEANTVLTGIYSLYDLTDPTAPVAEKYSITISTTPGRPAEAATE